MEHRRRMRLLVAAGIVGILIYVGLYVMTYEVNGLASIPFGAVEESPKIEIVVDQESDSIPWDIPSAQADSPKATFEQLFAPLRFFDFRIRSTAYDIGLSDYDLVRMKDGTTVVIWDE